MLPSELIAKLGECAITNFSAARDGWFDKQTVFSGIVIAGLVFEGPELIHELLAIAQKNFPSFRYVFPDALVEYAKIGAFVGWILIIAGLLGEMKASSRIVDLSAHIQECSDAKVTKATLEAGDAATSASLARREAARAKDNADVAAKLAADERSKRIKLANLLNPRSLNEQERKEIADELRPVANPDVKVEIFTTSGNGLRLGILIWNALKDAGYNPILQNPSTEVWYETNVGGPIEGVPL